MIRIYSSPVLAIVSNVKNVLELNGISCTITNEFLSAGAGELPPIEAWPQLWVAEVDAERASEIIETAEKDLGEPQETWVCPKCREEIEGQFSDCWNCGTVRNHK
jgi:Putative prokaryotic signal transducing protein